MYTKDDMIYQTYIDRNGKMKKKVLRNCDRCANIQDANGKFNVERRQTLDGYWRSLCELLMEAAK